MHAISNTWLFTSSKQSYRWLRVTNLSTRGASVIEVSVLPESFQTQVQVLVFPNYWIVEKVNFVAQFISTKTFEILLAVNIFKIVSIFFKFSFSFNFSGRQVHRYRIAGQWTTMSGHLVPEVRLDLYQHNLLPALTRLILVSAILLLFKLTVYCSWLLESHQPCWNINP